MGRAPCCDTNGLKKGPWTPEEDQKLLDYIQKNGYGNWRTLPKNAGLQRCGKSCRLRWTNYLRPDIKRGRFSFEEEETIIQLHRVLGNKWSAIAARLPGRTDNEIKNYWNTRIRKRLLGMGIDPVTHSPRLNLLELSSILYNSSQINISRLLGLQPQLANPELLRLATSLLSSSHCQNPNFLLQNAQENQLCNLENGVQNQLPPLIQNTQIQETPFSNDPQAQLIMQPNVEQFTNFNTQKCQLNDWQCNEMPSNNVNDQFIPLQNYSLFGSDQSIVEKSGFQSYNFSFTSNSNSPLNSNSTFVTSSCTTTDQDERESYCSSMLKFEMPDMLDVNCFM